MAITSIEIRNVKGIRRQQFSLRLMPNKPNLIVAPNGYGKSSIASAFASMNSRRMTLHDNDCHQCNNKHLPELILTLEDAVDGSCTLVANSKSNDIRKQFDVTVIRSGLTPKATKRNLGNFTQASASLQVQPISVESIPEKTTFSYKCSAIRTTFGVNGKVLPNIEGILADTALCDALKGCELAKTQGQRVQKKIGDAVSRINGKTGTTEEIRAWIADEVLPDLASIHCVNDLADRVAPLGGIASQTDAYLTALQLISLYREDAVKFDKALRRLRYTATKKYYQDLLDDFCSSKWQWAKLKEDRKKKVLSVIFPPAHQLSNGQRDLITLLIQMHRALYAETRKPLILVIDEVFDYLDDGNLVAFQYYVTNLIEEYNRLGLTLYPLILTHLDPGMFFDFCFNKHKIHTHYLYPQSSNRAENSIKLVRARDTEAPVKDRLEAHWFHYHPEPCVIDEADWPKALPVHWREAKTFHAYTTTELHQYLEGKSYDPLALCFAIRLTVEQSAYELLDDNDTKSDFLKAHGTTGKLDIAAEQLLDIPEIFFLLGLIYNTNLHWKQGRDYVTPLTNKLRHPSIMAMIRSVTEGNTTV